MQKRKDRNLSVRVYIDTCVLQGAISRRNEHDTIFMNSIEEKSWKVFTSIHTLMELLDIAKDRSFLMKSVINKWVDVSTFLQERKTKNLNRNDLNEISEELNNFFRDHSYIEFHGINEDVWNDVKDITEKSNLHSSDALHLALARAWQCQVLVTHDTFFATEGNKLLKEANQYDCLRICTPENVDKTIEEMVLKRTN
jgi:predicted nucleic acid-binding protein